jgi:endogenous inhibitor of DNA gyrase (YacG/DUF329 family)
MIDLDNWLSERYRIPVRAESPDEEGDHAPGQQHPKEESGE